MNGKLVNGVVHAHKAKQLLEGVVKNGSGRGININTFKVGGKTGTAQILKNGKYKADGLSSYQASFVGYFPADKPLYSCIVVIYEPSTGVYGGIVAAPVFKEIAEKVWAMRQSEYHQNHERYCISVNGIRSRRKNCTA
jgi:cell division protein FtsI (penicillin-binding protein 3)